MSNCCCSAHACPRRRPRQNWAQVLESTMPTPPTPLRPCAYAKRTTPLAIITPRAYVYLGVDGVGIVESTSYSGKWRGQWRGQSQSGVGTTALDRN